MASNKPVPQRETQNDDEMFLRFFQLIGQAVDSKLFNLCVVALFAWLFYQKTAILESKIDNCQSSKLEYYQQTSERMARVVEENTRAISEFQNCLAAKKVKP